MAYVEIGLVISFILILILFVRQRRKYSKVDAEILWIRKQMEGYVTQAQLEETGRKMRESAMEFLKSTVAVRDLQAERQVKLAEEKRRHDEAMRALEAMY